MTLLEVVAGTGVIRLTMTTRTTVLSRSALPAKTTSRRLVLSERDTFPTRRVRKCWHRAMRGLDETSADAGFVAWGSSARRILLALVLLFPISSDAWAWGDEGPRARAADGFDLVVLGALGGIQDAISAPR